jgi:predicted dienelactone hydrolase
MNRIMSIGALGFAMFLLLACNPAGLASPEATARAPEAMTTATVATPGPSPLPLSEPGKYYVGVREDAYPGASRGDRPVGITLWYPAVKPRNAAGSRPARDATADRSGAPYPLILSSTKVANMLAPYLVSHGFAWASVDGIDSYFSANPEMIDQPLDILFALYQVASSPPKGLDGLIDADHAGAIGYSFDGYNALAVSGARIDPEYYRAQCPTPDATTKAILGSMSAFGCAPAEKWDDFAAHAGEAIATSADGLWQPMTDERIRAVMPMAPEGWWLFGERGLAAADRPILIIGGTEDALYPEDKLIFEHLGASDKTLISFMGQEHMMVYDEAMVARMAHFAVAFFGYHLQGREEMARYFSKDFVAQHDDLAWGEYAGD